MLCDDNNESRSCKYCSWGNVNEVQEQDVETNVVVDEIVQEQACIMFYLLTDVHYLKTLYLDYFDNYRKT